jgi:hypothetical protein
MMRFPDRKPKMSIRIVKRPADVFVTEDELARYKEEHKKAFAMYAGTPPTLEEYIRQKQTEKTQHRGGHVIIKGG